MKIMDRLSRILGSRDQAKSEPESHVLGPFEIRLIAEGMLERLAEFAASSRLHAADAKGDTPLHLAARMGNLAVCDLFIRSGADPAALNHDRQTPADVAFAEGHGLAAQLLSSLVAGSTETETETVGEREVPPGVETVVAAPDSVPEHRIAGVQETEPADGDADADRADDLDDLLTFEAEAEPEEFFDQYAGDTASGTFVALISSSPVVSDNEDGDWDLDLSAAPIAGEGIGSSAAVTADHGAENDFLKVRTRGRQSVKRAVVQTGTRMSIDPELCFTWAEEILAKGRCSLDDIDHLVVHCEGNGDLEELRINLQRNLEAAGFDFTQATGHDVELWDAVSDTSSDDLADAIEAALTRRTLLPGTKRFVMDKSEELQLLEPMMRAKQELQLGILASETAVETILDVMDRIRDGSRDPGSVSLRTIIPSRPGHAETSQVMAAADTLRSWHTTGRVMDGKRRREALAALEALDLSLAFHKELVRRLEQFPACQAEASQLEAEILISESATEHLIREHLPYVRRFASRNVEEGEDPEDVFQVAFMGLQRSTRRFDPERGYRFLIYATYWMRQAITRWRSDEGAAIRIPVHRNEKITKLDRALERLDVRVGGGVSDLELAEELEWTIDEVRQFRGIPREAEYPASLDDWDNLLPEPSEVDVFDQAETERIVTEALADLPERQADVIRMRFGIGRETDMTLEEIGQIYGVTRERIRQIEAKGLDRLSHPGRKRRLRELLGM
ncbi:sigma-70 family RNA polymerase sigma factor [Marivita sp. GX14005]|uniref:sigma-70 family RNA polymerase sigma factor n=1 Tax=Marivita sp. GX14005 TaxID=2942276 RepID=UPI0020189DA9|nr:sigma-70 family RNA polymerase sigma factor [Marivita sp. GX14005]MCL3882548.1 sigma-70 family RNA polymerase sigma factor [Marivita sp. GX14005]